MVGRELLKDSEDLHPTLMNHPRILTALKVKMGLSSTDFVGKGRKVDKPVLDVFLCNGETVVSSKRLAFPL